MDLDTRIAKDGWVKATGYWTGKYYRNGTYRTLDELRAEYGGGAPDRMIPCAVSKYHGHHRADEECPMCDPEPVTADLTNALEDYMATRYGLYYLKVGESFKRKLDMPWGEVEVEACKMPSGTVFASVPGRPASSYRTAEEFLSYLDAYIYAGVRIYQNKETEMALYGIYYVDNGRIVSPRPKFSHSDEWRCVRALWTDWASRARGGLTMLCVRTQCGKYRVIADHASATVQIKDPTGMQIVARVYNTHEEAIADVAATFDRIEESA